MNTTKLGDRVYFECSLCKKIHSHEYLQEYQDEEEVPDSVKKFFEGHIGVKCSHCNFCSDHIWLDMASPDSKIKIALARFNSEIIHMT